MKNIDAIELHWADLLEDFFGLSLTDEQAKRWGLLLKQEQAGITDDEMNRVIMWARKFWKRWDRYRPTFVEISAMISAYRGGAGRGLSTNSRSESVEFYARVQDGAGSGMERRFTTMSELKSKLLACRDADEAWDIICLPLSAPQCRELEGLAQENGIKVRRFRPNTERIVKKLIPRFRGGGL